MQVNLQKFYCLLNYWASTFKHPLNTNASKQILVKKTFCLEAFMFINKTLMPKIFNFILFKNHHHTNETLCVDHETDNEQSSLYHLMLTHYKPYTLGISFLVLRAPLFL